MTQGNAYPANESHRPAEEDRGCGPRSIGAETGAGGGEIVTVAMDCYFDSNPTSVIITPKSR